MNYSFNIHFKFSLKTTRELLLNSMMVHSVENVTHTESDSSKEIICEGLELPFKQ